MVSDTLVIIPAYNEEKAISGVVSSIRKLYPEMDIVVVNDGSSDETVVKAEDAGAIVLSHSFNMGYGIALQTGYKYAFRRGYRFVVQIDGDGQHDPTGIKTVLDRVKDGYADIVLGSRFLSDDSYKPSLLRLTGIRFFRFLIRFLSGKVITDPTTGFQAMNRNVLNVFIQDFFPVDYPDADVVILLSGLGFKISEAPVLMRPNLGGKSMHSNPMRVLYYIFKMTLSMFLTKIRKYSIPGN